MGRIRVNSGEVITAIRGVQTVTDSVKKSNITIPSKYNLDMLSTLDEKVRLFDQHLSAYMTALHTISNASQEIVNSYVEKDSQIASKIKSN